MGRRMNNAVSSHFTTLMAPRPDADGKRHSGQLHQSRTILLVPGPTQLIKLNLKQQPLRVRSISREEQEKFEKKADYAIYFKKTATRFHPYFGLEVLCICAYMFETTEDLSANFELGLYTEMHTRFAKISLLA
ncbi:hypothetical protein V8E54_006690 [Elaphomyces granulatus]